jgi:hypothetical protein
MIVPRSRRYSDEIGEHAGDEGMCQNSIGDAEA